MTLTPHGEPRCPYVAASQWGTARCVLPEGHTGRHAYGPTEGDVGALAAALHEITCEDNPGHAEWEGCAETGPCADEGARLAAAFGYAERIAAAKSEALRETARDVLAGAPVGNERYTGVQIERYLNARANRVEAALAHPSTDPDG